MTKPSKSQRLLRRQLRSAGLEAGAVPGLAKFLALVEGSYDEFERHRQLTDHSTKLAADELAQVVDSLRSSERLFKSLARCSPNGIIYTDPHGLCLYANEQIQKLTGRRPAELAGMGWLSALPTEERPAFGERLAGSVDLLEDRLYEHRIIKSDRSVIWVSTRVGAVVDERDHSLLGWVAHIEDITERKLHEAELSKLARDDSLTQLLNRHAFSKRLAEMLADDTSQDQVAVALVDLDRFKLINDTFGHETGDHVLMAVAKKLKGIVEKGDLVARLGGDEFAVASRLSCSKNPADFGHGIASAIAGEVAAQDRHMHIGCSVGVAMSAAGSNPASLLRDADTAMYRAKRSPNRTYQVFDESFRQDVTARFILESELRSAVDKNEITMVYQPVTDSVTGRVSSLEALARWDNPVLGVVSPAEFIPAAEELGLIGALGEQLMIEACAQLQRWRTDDPGLRQVAISVNVSPVQLIDPDFPQVVRRALSMHGLSPSAIILEITEGAVLGNLDLALAALDELRELGVAIAIDDFGTGYSSLSYLERLPVDYLKIDQSFVHAMGESAAEESSNRLTETIVDLALRFGLVPVAEGVETDTQRLMLRHAGCDLMQGYLMARPMLPDDPKLLDILDRHVDAALSAAASEDADGAAESELREAITQMRADTGPPDTLEAALPEVASAPPTPVSEPEATV